VLDLKMTPPLPPTKDNKDFSKLTKEFGIIPYFSNAEVTGYVVLQTLYNLYQYSPTQSAVVNDIVRNSFEGDLAFMKRTLRGVRTPQQTVNELSFAEIEAVVTALSELGIAASDITECSINLGRDLKVCGNAYLLLRRSRVNKAIQYEISTVHPLHCFIQQNDANTDRWFFITEFLNREYLGKFPAKKVRMYPEFSESDGVEETIIHLKTNTNASDYYGRPLSQSSVLQQLTEYTASVKIQSISANGLTAAYILAEEAQEMSGAPDDEQTAVNNKADRIRARATIENNTGKTLLYMQYGHGLKEPKLLKLDLHLDEAYDRFVSEDCQTKICMSHGYPSVLLDTSMQGASIGGNNTIIYAYAVADAKVIKPFQDQMSNVWSLLFEILAAEKPILNEYQVFFPSKLQELITTLSNVNIKNNATTQNNITQ